ncbi:hypothetical protein GCM10028791_20770 [Echinicola sediminis]
MILGKNGFIEFVGLFPILRGKHNKRKLVKMMRVFLEGVKEKILFLSIKKCDLYRLINAEKILIIYFYVFGE